MSANVGSAATGLQRMGYRIEGFLASELEEMPLHRSTVVKGSINSIRRALDLLNVPQPANLNVPDSLRKYTHRKMWTTTLGQVRRYRSPVFVKPADVQKGFQGHVAYPGWPSWTSDLPGSYKVLASEVVDFETEWRVYVLRGEILGICSYEGGWMHNRTPSKTVLNRMIADFKDAPVAYAMDVGKMIRPGDKPVLALVEINEGFALGNYGLSHVNYAKMVEARWKEMVSVR